MKTFWAFNEEAFKSGAIDVLHKQLISVAVALTTQCPYCIELHMKAARKAGANDTMLTETAIIAAAMRANATVTHATHLFKESSYPSQLVPDTEQEPSHAALSR